jgi:hypothetical protein
VRGRLLVLGSLVVLGGASIAWATASSTNGPRRWSRFCSSTSTTIIPGHGDPFRDKDRLRKYQAYLRDLWKQAGDLKKQGLSPDDAAKQIDLTSHKGAMLRIYDVIDGRLLPR